ncbi:hypothetical protein Ddye_029219 [Dipteronia dyeriana]|uniref:Uncharacterized protein n=1 Tax=Dipteronia dyeriana TaxID=168575 RepID=A0AAD9WLA3_9ROSI|nr:hypothetical protein Ddye_029219 [Dipteronia dyeriana]
MPCERITNQPYKMTNYLPAYHYIVIVPHESAVQVAYEESPPIDCQDLCPEYLKSPEIDDFLREIQEEEEIRLGDPLLEDKSMKVLIKKLIII